MIFHFRNHAYFCDWFFSILIINFKSDHRQVLNSIITTHMALHDRLWIVCVFPVNDNTHTISPVCDPSVVSQATKQWNAMELNICCTTIYYKQSGGKCGIEYAYRPQEGRWVVFIYCSDWQLCSHPTTVDIWNICINTYKVPVLGWHIRALQFPQRSFMSNRGIL